MFSVEWDETVPLGDVEPIQFGAVGRTQGMP